MGCDLLFQGTFGPLNTRFQSFQPILHAGFAGFTRWMVDLTRSAGGRHLLKFTLLTPFLHTFSSLSLSLAPTSSLIHYLGLLEFPVRICDALQPQYTRDVPINLSYEYDCDLITGFPFDLVFTYVSTECVCVTLEVT